MAEDGEASTPDGVVPGEAKAYFSDIEDAEAYFFDVEFENELEKDIYGQMLEAINSGQTKPQARAIGLRAGLEGDRASELAAQVVKKVVDHRDCLRRAEERSLKEHRDAMRPGNKRFVQQRLADSIAAKEFKVSAAKGNSTAAIVVGTIGFVSGLLLIWIFGPIGAIAFVLCGVSLFGLGGRRR